MAALPDSRLDAQQDSGSALAPRAKSRPMKKPCAHHVVVLVGCAIVLAACGPSINSAAKADIDQRIAVMAPSGAAFPPPTALVPRPILVGQWTQHKMVSEKGQPSLLTYKIVGEEGGAYWIEVANESYDGKTVNKILLALGDRSNPATMEIRAVKMKDKQGRVTELQGPAISLMKAAYQSSINMLAVTWQGLPQETASVVAGNFASCFKAMTNASWGPWRSTATSWMHPSVPISGLVKSVGISQPTTMELVGFGESGATSEIP
jgi:hypothetical protein